MYIPKSNRYDNMVYNRCGKSGLKLSAISLGLWHNFSETDNFDNMLKMVYTAFDNGIIHFDLANNYGGGSAEENFRKILDKGLRPYRDELCISTKAGYDMWAGPYGSKHGSRKYLIASLDQSLKRLGIDYVDIYYHHVFDPDAPIEEIAVALNDIVRQGKALYVGVSNYNRRNTAKILEIFKELKTPFIINQPSYSMLNRWIEDDGLDDFAVQNGLGLIAYSPLSQGMLTDKYLHGIPKNSRIGKGNTWLAQQLTDERRIQLIKLNEIAKERGQKLSQMAVSWILRNGKITSVLIGASNPQQILENVEAIKKTTFTDDEILRIEEILKA
ncbi:MAG: aldo/keto reductase [Oscillospiraceae bacterium]